MKLTHFTYDVKDGVATVVIDRADQPMNTMGPDLMQDLVTILDDLETNDEVRAVVIGSAKPTGFMAGADIKWLETIDSVESAEAAATSGHTLLNRLENLHKRRNKPVVAAIHGPALGGGCELALACSYRIITDDPITELGQPEIKLGLIPGAGGTQRLPRLVGLSTGLDLILTGRSVRGGKASAIGLADEVVPKEVLVATAHKRALELTAAEEPKSGLERLRAFADTDHLKQIALEDNPLGRKLIWNKAEEAMLEETGGNYPAAIAALDVIRTGFEQGIEAGNRAEIKAFGQLVVSPEAKALISLFLGTTALKKDLGVRGKKVEPRSIAKIGMVGGGLMGGGIAAVTAVKARVPVRFKEIDTAAVGRAIGHVNRYVEGQQQRRRLSESEAAATMQLVTGSAEWDGFDNVDLVIEAVPEDLELKQSVLKTIEQITDKETIFASNTSSIPIGAIAEAGKRPENVIGMHYFSPVEKMPLLEVIVTDTTADWVTATCVRFGQKQGKTVIVVNDGTGFYTSRIIAPYTTEAMWMLDEGVAIDAIDNAMTDWGFPVGPVLLSDEVGIDVGAKIAPIMVAAFGERMAAPPALEAVAKDDRLGRKNGRGFYLYEKGKRQGPDESIYQLIGSNTRRVIPKDVIQRRCSLVMINEAVRCLEEGVLRSARDGDIGAVFGLGYPPFRGGPFHTIDRLGADTVVAQLERLEEKHGERFKPAKLLKKHAKTGKPFSE